MFSFTTAAAPGHGDHLDHAANHRQPRRTA